MARLRRDRQGTGVSWEWATPASAPGTLRARAPLRGAGHSTHSPPPSLVPQLGNSATAGQMQPRRGVPGRARHRNCRLLAPSPYVCDQCDTFRKKSVTPLGGKLATSVKITHSCCLTQRRLSAGACVDGSPSARAGPAALCLAWARQHCARQQDKDRGPHTPPGALCQPGAREAPGHRRSEAEALHRPPTGLARPRSCVVGGGRLRTLNPAMCPRMLFAALLGTRFHPSTLRTVARPSPHALPPLRRRPRPPAASRPELRAVLLSAGGSRGLFQRQEPLVTFKTRHIRKGLNFNLFSQPQMCSLGLWGL